jgi:hypothetical protein
MPARQPDASGLLSLWLRCFVLALHHGNQETMKWLHWTFKAAPGVGSTGVHLTFY